MPENASWSSSWGFTQLFLWTLRQEVNRGLLHGIWGLIPWKCCRLFVDGLTETYVCIQKVVNRFLPAPPWPFPNTAINFFFFFYFGIVHFLEEFRTNPEWWLLVCGHQSRDLFVYISCHMRLFSAQNSWKSHTLCKPQFANRCLSVLFRLQCSCQLGIVGMYTSLCICLLSLKHSVWPASSVCRHS